MELQIRKLQSEDTVLALRDRLLIELAYGSGLRREELRRLNVADVNCDDREIRVLGKGNKIRIVPVTTKTIEVMREYLFARGVLGGPLFMSAWGRRLSANSIYLIFKNRTGVNPHRLRHTCAGEMLKNGCSIRIIQEILGHNSLASTQIYTHIKKCDLSNVLNVKHPRSIVG